MRALRTPLFFLLALIPVAMACAVGDAWAGSRADSIHWAAWDSALVRCDSDHVTLYSLYAYRTLAVPHPDVYLKADQLFAEVIENVPGSRDFYRTPDVRDYARFDRLRSGDLPGRSFTFRDWTIVPDSIYDTVGVELSWLDRRCPSVAVLLQTPTQRLSSFDAALIRYTQLRRRGTARDSLFVIVDNRGRGFLSVDNELFYKGLEEFPDSVSSVHPILVFNEESVYYPLLRRDDRMRSSSLGRLVSRLGSIGITGMPLAQLRRIGLIRTRAWLRSERAEQLALLAASGLCDTRIDKIKNKWLGNLESYPSDAQNCVDAMMTRIQCCANRLSPYTAQLSAILVAGPFEEQVQTLEAAYLQLSGRHPFRADTSNPTLESWGIVWSPQLLGIGIDDIIRARAGEHRSQWRAMSAILQLADVDHFGVRIRDPHEQMPDQYWVFADSSKFQFNFGTWTRLKATDASASRPVIAILGYGMPGRWCDIGSREFCANEGTLEIANDLYAIANRLTFVNVLVRVPTGEVFPLARLSAENIEDQWTVHPLPWQDAESR